MFVRFTVQKDTEKDSNKMLNFRFCKNFYNLFELFFMLLPIVYKQLNANFQCNQIILLILR
jgi:hypothetical protein